MQTQETRRLTPDDRGRIIIGKIEDVVSYQAIYNPDGTILLTPMVEIPLREAWLHKNKEALASVQLGLQQSAAGEVAPFDMSSLPHDE